MPTTLITGANRGIGLEIARQHAADGWRVHATCRNPAGAEALDALAAEHEGRMWIHPLDVTDRESIAAVAETIGAEPIDVLWLNAGLHGSRAQTPEEVDLDEWSEVFRVNAMGPLLVAGAFADHVARAENGRIVVVSSVMGSVGGNLGGGNYVYRSSKAATNMVARSLSIDLAPRGVVVAAVHPGWVRTDMGGAKAPISPEESVTGLREVVDGLGTAESGSFLDFRGSPLPW